MGWRHHIVPPEFGIASIRAKMDAGALKSRIRPSGVPRVMAALGMIPARGLPKARARSVRATSSS